MASSFIPCPACARHVREGECVCPFCGANGVCAARAKAAPGALLSRAALFAGAAGASLALAECSASPQPLYGGVYVPPDAAIDGTAVDATADAPAKDDATTDSAADAPSVVALYGAVIVPDAGEQG
jgi:hypothetical protein